MFMVTCAVNAEIDGRLSRHLRALLCVSFGLFISRGLCTDSVLKLGV